MKRKHDIGDILQNGQELFRKQGYHNTGIEEILRVCKIPKGSFYNFFTSKEDFGLRVLEIYSEKLCTMIEQTLTDATMTPLRRLQKFYTTITSMSESENCKNGCLLANLTQELGGTNNQMSLATKKTFERWISLLATCVAEGQEKGEIIDDYSAEEIANFLHNSFNGALLRMKAGQDAKPLHLFHKIAFSSISLK